MLIIAGSVPGLVNALLAGRYGEFETWGGSVKRRATYLNDIGDAPAGIQA